MTAPISTSARHNSGLGITRSRMPSVPPPSAKRIAFGHAGGAFGGGTRPLPRQGIGSSSAPQTPGPRPPPSTPLSANACGGGSTPAITSSGSSTACPPPPIKPWLTSRRPPSPNSRPVLVPRHNSPRQRPEHLPRHRRHAPQGASPDGYIGRHANYERLSTI